MLIPKFLNLLFLDCNSKLTDELRIRLSLVYIHNGYDRIQTGAITNIPGIIFALGTNEIRTISDIYDKQLEISKKATKNILSCLKAMGGEGGDVYIVSREDKNDGLVRLVVSNSTINLAYLRSS